MTTPQNWTPYVPPTPPPTPAATRRYWPFVVAAAALIVAAAIVVLVMSNRPHAPAVATTKPAVPVDTCGEDLCSTPTPTPTATPTAAGPVLTVADIHLTLKTTDKECFGSAGCNVQVKVEMGPLDEMPGAGETWEVTYEITGGNDGSSIGSFDITGDKYEINTEMVSTASSKSKLHVKVTDVERLGF